GLHHVVADLITPCDLALFVVEFFDLGTAFLFLDPVKLCLQEREGYRVVFVLAALAAAFGGDASWQVGVADTAFGLVLVLSARSATAKRVALELVWLDLNFNGPLDLGHDVHGGEGRLPAGVGVEGTDPHEAMDTRFALEVAIRIVA